MEAKAAAGPDVDVAFFNELRAVFDKYPDAAPKYAIRSPHQEIGKLKIDFAKQHAVSRVEGTRIITEFENTPDPMAASHHACCEWYKSGGRWRCVRQCLE